MTTVAKNALQVIDPAKLKISHSDYAGKTPADARKAIRLLLDDYNVAIATESVDKSKITPYLQGKDFPDYIQSYGQMEGVAWVRVFYDGTDNTGTIKNGHPVVIDTVKGNAVTGINTTWTPDQYKIVGTALQDYSTPNVEGNRIQVRLAVQTPSVVNYNDYAIAVFNSTLPACDWNAGGGALWSTTPPEFGEVTNALIYVPQKKSNGKYAYSAISGFQKVVNSLPFAIVGGRGFYVTYLNGDWLLKRSVDSDFHYEAYGIAGALGGGLKVNWTENPAAGSPYNSSLARLAEIQNNTDIVIVAKGTLLYKVEAKVLLQYAGSYNYSGDGSHANDIWRNDVALGGASGSSVPSWSTIRLNIESTVIAPATQLFPGTDNIIQHTMEWTGYLETGRSFSIVNQWGGGTVIAAKISLTPLIQQP